MKDRLSPLDILKREIFRLYKKSVIKKHQLNYLFWECTLRCNLNCLHCGSDCLKKSSVPDMPAQDFIQVIKGIKKTGLRNLTVCITGGEPLLRDDLEYVGQEIRKCGYNWGLVTNGLLMTAERFNSLISNGMRSMSVSLDGLEAEHTFLRQNPKSFKNVENTINLCVEHKKKSKNFVFDVITCVHQNNLKTLPALRDYLIQHSVENWRIFSIFPSGRAEEKKNELGVSPKEYLELMQFIEQTRLYVSEDNKKIHLNYSCEGYLGKYELKVRDYFFFCRGGINVGSVMCNGDVSACLSVRGKDFIQGNIYENDFDFMTIWNSKYKCMRHRKWAKIGRCAKCHSWRWCEGNGLHLHKDCHSESLHCGLIENTFPTFCISL